GCRYVPDDAACDLPDDCVAGRCDPSAGCTDDPVPDGAACFADRCTYGACSAGACAATVPVDCDDGNPCTADACEAGLGCVHPDDPSSCPCSANGVALPAGTRCADGSDCTAPDACDGQGNCVSGASCDDGDPCTADICAAFTPTTPCFHLDVSCPSDCTGLED